MSSTFIDRSEQTNWEDETTMEIIAVRARRREIQIPNKWTRKRPRYLGALAVLVFATAIAPAQHNRNPACACDIPMVRPTRTPISSAISACTAQRTGLPSPRLLISLG